MNAVLATKRIKIAEATYRQLNYLTAKAQGYTITVTPDPYEDMRHDIRASYAGDKVRFYLRCGMLWAPATINEQGHPICDQHDIAREPYIAKELGPERRRWKAHKLKSKVNPRSYTQHGDTSLQAGLRCYLLSCLGEEAEMPVELC